MVYFLKSADFYCVPSVAPIDLSFKNWHLGVQWGFFWVILVLWAVKISLDVVCADGGRNVPALECRFARRIMYVTLTINVSKRHHAHLRETVSIFPEEKQLVSSLAFWNWIIQIPFFWSRCLPGNSYRRPLQLAIGGGCGKKQTFVDDLKLLPDSPFFCLSIIMRERKMRVGHDRWAILFLGETFLGMNTCWSLAVPY